MSARYVIRLNGCDDETEIFMDLEPHEAELIERVSAASKAASTYGCMPRLNIQTVQGDEQS